MTERMYAVVMAGGKGRRFWPLSAGRRPKQMLALAGPRPLVAMSVDRLRGLIPSERVFVITGADLTEPVAELLPELPRENIVGEPCGRDTAAACALGLALVRRRDPAAAFCVLTADHVIADVERFQTTLRDAFATAFAENTLTTIGITPAFASTGFGYIECGASLERPGATRFYRARRFVEKPEKSVAQDYVKAGNFYWNSGMFVWTVQAFATALRNCRPPLADMAERLDETVDTPRFASALAREYQALEKISIDYAVMEHADNIAMARGDFGWDDIGSWPAVAAYFDKDADGNVREGRCATLDCAGNLVFSRAGDRLTALVGVRDMVVVQTDKATLICPKERAQDVKGLVETLERQGDNEDVL
jgi:mannose-1-phosphate guanylyltransferase